MLLLVMLCLAHKIQDRLVESCLMVLLNEPKGTLGRMIKRAGLDEDIERLISQAYGFASNRSFVRHGGTTASSLGKLEAEFFLEFSASAIVYIAAKLKIGSADASQETPSK